MMNVYWLVVLLCSLVYMISVDSYKILVLFPFPSRSHSILGDGYVRNLLAAGHQVTHATPYPPTRPHANQTIIDLSSIKREAEAGNKINVTKTSNGFNFMDDSDNFFLYLRKVTKLYLNHPNLQAMLRDPNEKFDAVLTEWMVQDLTDTIGGVLETNIIVAISTQPHLTTLSRVDALPSPAVQVLLFDTSMLPYNFIGRIKSLLFQFGFRALSYFYQGPFEREMYVQSMTPVAKARGIELPDYDEVNRNISLILCNTHESLMEAQSLPLNVKLVAGYHIDPVVPPLPKDLQDIMDNSKDGVILFSLGSNFKSADLSNETKATLLNAFAKRKETILWKLEEQISNLPKNVFIKNWLPQASILAHPHIKLFITHGGMLSNLEAIHYGVPVVGVPIFADQFYNLVKVEQKGYGIKVEISDDFGEKLESAVNEVLSNNTYKERITELSGLFYDRQLSPIDESVYWIEYVIRTNGAKHLRSVTRDVPLYQKLYLDLLTLVVIILIILFKIIKIIFNMLFNKVKKVNIRKKKN